MGVVVGRVVGVLVGAVDGVVVGAVVGVFVGDDVGLYVGAWSKHIRSSASVRPPLPQNVLGLFSQQST